MFIPAIYGEIGDGFWHDYQHYPKIAVFFSSEHHGKIMKQIMNWKHDVQMEYLI